jgi:hypothetical protein
LSSRLVRICGHFRRFIRRAEESGPLLRLVVALWNSSRFFRLILLEGELEKMNYGSISMRLRTVCRIIDKQGSMKLSQVLSQGLHGLLPGVPPGSPTVDMGRWMRCHEIFVHELQNGWRSLPLKQQKSPAMGWLPPQPVANIPGAVKIPSPRLGVLSLDPAFWKPA